MQNPNPNLTQSSADFSCLRSAQQTSAGLKAQSYAEPLLLCLSYVFSKSLPGHCNLFPQLFHGLLGFFPRLSPSFFCPLSSCTVQAACACCTPSCCVPISTTTSSFKVNFKCNTTQETRIAKAKFAAACVWNCSQRSKWAAGQKKKKNTPSVIKCLHIRLTKKSH